MQLTLRQARKLEISLEQKTIEGQVSDIRAYDEDIALADIQAGVDSLWDATQDAIRLNEIRYNIRHAINVKNMEHGVSGMLNERDRLYTEKNFLSSISNADDTHRLLKCVINKPEDTKRVSMVRQELVDLKESRLAHIENRMEDIKFGLINVNNSVCIELQEDDLQYLESRGLV